MKEKKTKCVWGRVEAERQRGRVREGEGEPELDPANITSSIFRGDLLCYSGARAHE